MPRLTQKLCAIYVERVKLSIIITLRVSEAAAQCIVIGPVCGCVFVGLLPR